MGEIFVADLGLASRSDTDKLLGEMKVRVTTGQFHQIHDIAGDAEHEVKEHDISKFPTTKLLRLLRNLEAGQRLTNAEDHSYSGTIGKVEKEIKKRR